MDNVTWVDAENMSVENTVTHKLIRLIRKAEAVSQLTHGMRVALKVNTAEEGYEYGLRPGFFKVFADVAGSATEKRPVVCDGHKLVDYWKQSKGNAFLTAASARGYSNYTLAGHFVINGGFSGDEGELFPCGSPDSEIGGVEIGTAVCRSDALWVLSHVTLHPLFGLSGALLNGGFECLTARARTRLLRGINPYIFNGLNPTSPNTRMFRQLALESCLGVKAALEGHIFYVNYLWDITPQPEYYPYSAKPVIENIGFMASDDPVALDAASFALLEERIANCQAMAEIDFKSILEKAEDLGIGSMQYKTISLS